MKALLTSSGITNTNIINALCALTGKLKEEINVAVILEASAVEPGDKRWLFDELQLLGKTFGGDIDIINVLALDSETILERLQFADVIYVSGGMSDYLMTVFRRTGFSELLYDARLQSKVYVGSSAGSMVFGRRITTEGYKEIYRNGEQDFGVKEYMAFVDFAIFPHLNSQLFVRNRPEIIKQAAKGLNYPVYAIMDSQAVVVDGDSVSFVGGDAYVANQ